MDDLDQSAGRHPVERIEHTRGIAAFVDLQAPRQVGRPTVKLLVEIVTEPPNRLGQNDSRRDRVAERGQRNPVAPASNPRADASERDGPPDAEAAVPNPKCSSQTRSVVTEVGSPVGDDVVQPATDQAERHGPQCDVVDDAGFASPGHPSPISEHQCGDDPDDDEQRIRAERHTEEIPDTLRRTRDVRKQGCRHAVILCRTPSASSSVKDRSAGMPSLSADTKAEPTITPSA